MKWREIIIDIALLGLPVLLDWLRGIKIDREDKKE